MLERDITEGGGGGRERCSLMPGASPRAGEWRDGEEQNIPEDGATPGGDLVGLLGPVVARRVAGSAGWVGDSG